MPRSTSGPRWWPIAWFVVVISSAAAVYLVTLAPTITWSHLGTDGGDLAAAVATRGIPHPSGYPTYLLLGRFFALLPWGDLAHRLNVMSALWASLTVGTVYLILVQTFKMFAEGEVWTLHSIAAVAGALAFAFSPLFWSQALITEVHTLHNFFVALVTYLLVCWLEEPRLWRLAAAGLALGVGLGNHLTLLLLTPSILVLLLNRPRELPLSLGGIMAVVLPCLVGLSIYATLPLRASRIPPVNWGDPRTLEGFLWAVTGGPYRRYVFALPLRQLPSRLAAWSRLLLQQFGWWGLFPGMIGFASLWHSARAIARATLLLFLGTSLYALGYDTADSNVYLIPAYLVSALWVGWGLREAGSQMLNGVRPEARATLLSLVALLLILPSLFLHFRALDLSADTAASDYARVSLSIAASDALIISSADRHTFALWYARYGQGWRPDVVVVDDALLGYAWYRHTLSYVHPDLSTLLSSLPSADAGEQPRARPTEALIRLALDHRPVYLTDPYEDLQTQFLLSAEDPLHRVLPP